MMTRLETTFLGIHFPNPFLLAAGPPSSTAQKVIRAFKAGWGGAVLKTFGLEPTPNVSPRIMLIRSGRRNIGMFDIELFSSHTLDWWLSQIEAIRVAYPDRPLIASIAGSDNAYSWQEVVRRVEPLGVKAFEMNLSCPSFDLKKGSVLGQDPGALRQAVAWVREVTDLPVIVKLTPNVTDVVELGRVALQAGANAFTSANSLTGIAGIDLDSFTPLPSVEGYGIVGGYGGPGLKPVSLRCTANLAQNLGVPMMGVGGVTRWQDAVEYLAVGASVVQVCTAVMLNGFEMVHDLKKGLIGYLDEKGFAGPSEVVGKALPKLSVFSKLDVSSRHVARIDLARCNGCALCVRACETGGFEAIHMEGKVPIVDRTLCDGCGLCQSLCPLAIIEMAWN
jgi:dihydropyrimidine dehydrogenase (NAD+) subunit PreA